jgi:hypothetical protein
MGGGANSEGEGSLGMKEREHCGMKNNNEMMVTRDRHIAYVIDTGTNRVYRNRKWSGQVRDQVGCVQADRLPAMPLQMHFYYSPTYFSFPPLVLQDLVLPPLIFKF